MNSDTLNRVLAYVKAERGRQEEMKAAGRFKFTPDEVPLIRSFAMLSEEVGEVARDILSVSGYVQEERGLDDVRKELIHVAAIAVAMIEGIETFDHDHLIAPA